MIVLIQTGAMHNNGRKTTVVCEFICSEIEDIDKLPTSKTTDPAFVHTPPHPGSTCICTDGEIAIYMLGADDVWGKLSSFK